MNRGLYEGKCGILLCRYDALMNTVEERYFLPSDRPYQVVKEELGKLSVVNENEMAWLSYRGMILEVRLSDTQNPSFVPPMTMMISLSCGISV